MKVIIAGSRTITDYKAVKRAYKDSGFEATLIVSGGAEGVDKLGERLAKELNIPCYVLYAEWEQYGKSAGYKRNEQMAKYADALVAVWDGESRGTVHMIDIMDREQKPRFVRLLRRNK